MENNHRWPKTNTYLMVRMKVKNYPIGFSGWFTLLALCLALTGCKSALESIMTAKLTEPIYYQQPDGGIFIVRYGALSDGSLHFMKLATPDGKDFTLQQTISGSGVRYTDDRNYIWWEHHGKVNLEIRAPEGKWINLPIELRLINQ